MEPAPTLTFAAVEERKQQPGARASPFHGANAGSNPAGDANSMACRRTVYSLFNKTLGKNRGLRASVDSTSAQNWRFAGVDNADTSGLGYKLVK